jgi:leader peptidase (prepilin peptidase)/N-methyltransferase
MPAKPAARVWWAVAAAAVLGGALAASAALGGAGWVVPVLQGVIFALVAAGGAWAAVVDVRSRTLPNTIVYPLGAATGVLTVSLAAAAGRPMLIVWAAVYAAGLFAVYYLLGLAGGIGLGDVKLAAVLGAFLAPYGLLAVIGATLAAYLLALVQVAVLLARGRGRRAQLAFGPYLVAGALLAAAVGWIVGGGLNG